MATVEEILIKLSVMSEGAIAQLNAFRFAMRNIERDSERGSLDVMRATEKNFRNMSNISKAIFSTGQFTDINAELKTLGQKNMPRTIDVTKAFQAAAEKAISDMDRLAAATKNYGRAGLKGAALIKPIDNVLADINAKIKEQGTKTTPFAGWAMSIMFFGMALQRVFNTIWKEGTKTFQDIMHSVEGTTTGFDQLQGATTFLKYSLGQALEPLAMAILPIIETISDWISKNEELTRIIVAAFGIGGTILATLGMAILAKNGIIDMLSRIPASYDELLQKDWSNLGSTISRGIGIISIFWALESAKDAYKAFEEEDVGRGIINAISASAFAGAWIVKSPKAKGALFAIGVAMELVEQGVFFKTIGLISNVIHSFITATAGYIKDSFKDGISAGLVDGFLIAMLNLSKNSIALKILGVTKEDIQATINSIKGIQAPPIKSWSTRFQESFMTNKKDLDELDARLTNFVDTGSFALPSNWIQPTTTTPNQPVNNYYNFYLPSGQSIGVSEYTTLEQIAASIARYSGVSQ